MNIKIILTKIITKLENNYNNKYIYLPLKLQMLKLLLFNNK